MPDAPLHIPADRRERNPLITEDGFRTLKRMLEHPDAPAWNYTVGDRVVADDLPAVEQMRARMETRLPGEGRPPPEMLDVVARTAAHTAAFRERLADVDDIERDWAHIPCMSREDLAVRIEDVVPDDADLERLIVYDTSGTTGHAIHVPHHPRAMAMNHPFMEFVLERHGASARFTKEDVACVCVGAQVETVVFATVFGVWDQAGFAKVNFHERVWTPEMARSFLADLSPRFLTGDPVGFSEMLRWGVDLRPEALLSTAVELSPERRDRLADAYGCPVVDTYATTETGPVAYAPPDGEGLCVLPPDIYVEIVDADGRPLPEGEFGEICVSGGRNPYVPLLRYRTGDSARMVWSDPLRSDPAPRLLDLSARAPVVFRAADGSVVNPVDVGRVIRPRAVVQHEFVQHADMSVELALRPAPGMPVDPSSMEAALRRLFGDVPSVTVRIEPELGLDGKTIPFRSELAGAAQ